MKGHEGGGCNAELKRTRAIEAQKPGIRPPAARIMLPTQVSCSVFHVLNWAVAPAGETPP